MLPPVEISTNRVQKSRFFDFCKEKRILCAPRAQMRAPTFFFENAIYIKKSLYNFFSFVITQKTKILKQFKVWTFFSKTRFFRKFSKFWKFFKKSWFFHQKHQIGADIQFRLSPWVLKIKQWFLVQIKAEIYEWVGMSDNNSAIFGKKMCFKKKV